jgi:hypothetical protein
VTAVLPPVDMLGKSTVNERLVAASWWPFQGRGAKPGESNDEATSRFSNKSITIGNLFSAI